MSIKGLIMKSSLKGSFHPHREAAPMVQDRPKRGKGTDWRAIRLSGGCPISPFCLSLALLVIAVPSHASLPTRRIGDQLQVFSRLLSVFRRSILEKERRAMGDVPVTDGFAIWNTSGPMGQASSASRWVMR